jgi:tetraacyldisaccharide 4'-kinase
LPDFLWRADESPARRALLAPLSLLEQGYLAGAALHRWVYEAGLRARVRLDARVVCVGNLAVGGSAKTPLAAYLARALAARGRKPALLARGVGGRLAREVNVVSDGARVYASAADVGEEPLLLAAAAPGVPVLAGVNRVALGLRAIAAYGVESLVLDDGFQHHRLLRDLDLVCLDAKLGLGNGHALPRGPLRERASALARAGALVLTRAQPGDSAPPGAERFPRDTPVFRVALRKLALRALDGGARTPLERLRGARVGLLAAIARPDRLADELRTLGAEVNALRVFRDHHPYAASDLAGLDPNLLWVTTAKDAVKIPPSWAAGPELVVLEEEVVPQDGEALAAWVESRLFTS